MSKVNRDSVGCEASPGPSRGVSPAVELVAQESEIAWMHDWLARNGY